MSKTFLRLILVLAVGITLSIGFAEASANSSFLDISEKYIREYTDMSDKLFFSPSVSNSDDSICAILFDFRDGNEQITAIQGAEGRVFAIYKDTEEQLSVLFHMITKFKEIESTVPEGMSLAYRVSLSSTKEFYIISENVDSFCSVP